MRLSELQTLFEAVFFSVLTGVGSTFTMFVALYFDVHFHYYLLYWFMMFAENMVMISLWYQWSSNFGFWYHTWAIWFVNSSYVLSLIIKMIHSYIYNRQKTNIFNWKFSKCLMLTKKAEDKTKSKAEVIKVLPCADVSPENSDPSMKYGNV